MDELKVVIATDCGSTTTKAILIEKLEDGYRQTCRGEAPTTVEAPYEDVTRGVLNAIQEVEELSGRRILDGERIITPASGNSGVDIFISTSSAGGGLQMMVGGVVQSMTAQSAQRCALGAGAIVMDVLATNDGRLPYQKIERIRQLRPDMLLLSGGTDGGTVSHVVELAEFVAAADVKPRFGTGFQLPVIYAGNRDAREEVEAVLNSKTSLTVTENLRPVLEQENLSPARQVIHDLFLEHVMAQAPGYRQLMTWTGAPIMPTPGAVGQIIQAIARQHDLNVIGVDIGGATTDVFSVFGGAFNRTVSANLGMSYSISNVLSQAGLEQVMRWVPFRMDESELRDRVKNKMIRPTTVPQLKQELQVEQAIAREALRLALDQHKELAVELTGVQTERTMSDVFDQKASGAGLVDMQELDLLVGSGGVLSHAPRRAQAAAMLVDAFQPDGVTRLAVDSIFMMPHLGVFATVDESAASQVFERDCLVYLGTCVAPAGMGKEGSVCAEFEIFLPGGMQSGALRVGELRRYALAADEEAALTLRPRRGWNVGSGKGNELQVTVRGGEAGVILDGRGRPLSFASGADARLAQVDAWNKAMGVY